MRRHRLVGVVSACGALLLSGCGPTWSSLLVSRNAAGTGSGDGTSGDLFDGNYGYDFEYSLSADGTRLAFLSRANDLVADDTNPAPDIFVRDLATGATELVSVDASGAPVPGKTSLRPVISADGTKVAFATDANLAANDTGTATDIYVRDLASGTTTLVSVNAAGTDGVGVALAGSEDEPVFSPDGTKVVFVSYASDLGPVDSAMCPLEPQRPGVPPFTPCSDVYLRDLTTGTTTLVSGNAAGTDSRVAFSEDPVFSPDGTAVAFESNDLLPGSGAHYAIRVYRRDLTTGTLELVSVNAAGTGPANGENHDPMYSPAGELVFRSTSTDLVEPAQPGPWYVRDVGTATTSALVPGVRTGGEQPTFNGDGTVVAFSSDENFVDPADTHGMSDVFVHDRTTGTLTLASRLPDGGLPDGNSSRAVLDADGTRVAFTSSAANLSPELPTCPGDSPLGNHVCSLQVYVRDLERSATSRVSNGPDGAAGDRDSLTGEPGFLPDGRLLYGSRAGNLGVIPDTNDTWDIYLAAVDGLTVAVDTGTPGPGRTTVVVAGHYSCGPFSSGTPDRGTIDLTLHQRHGRRTVTGHGYLDPTTCDGTDQLFTATVTAVGTGRFHRGDATWSASGYVEGDSRLQHTAIPPTALVLTR